MSTAVTTFPPLAPARPATNKWLVTISVTFGTLMGAIDASIVNVALPHVRGAVGATLQEITWITTGFAIATVIVMPLTAFLGRLFGQKRVYMASLLLFVASSALCGVASSLTQLVLFRVLQGFGAGALQPTEQAILRQTFPPEEQGTAMALFGMAVMIGPAVGPTLGGWIVDNFHWSWIFFINLPVGALGLTMVWRFVHEPEDIRAANAAAAEVQRRNMDWAGIALLAVGLATLQYFLEEGQQDDWFESRIITATALVAVVALCLFVWRELTARVPAVNLRLFKDPVFTSGSLIGAIMCLSNLYVGFKAGWSLGVTITAAIMAFAIFKVLRTVLPFLVRRDMGILEINILVTLASACAFIASAGLSNAVPALTMVSGKTMTTPQLAVWVAVILSGGCASVRAPDVRVGEDEPGAGTGIAGLSACGGGGGTVQFQMHPCSMQAHSPTSCAGHATVSANAVRRCPEDQKNNALISWSSYPSSPRNCGLLVSPYIADVPSA